MGPKKSSDLLMLKEKKTVLNDIQKGFGPLQPLADAKPTNFLYHYTSLPDLFNILEGDSLWATATRFSNDSSEELVLSDTSYFEESGSKMDNFLICLSQNSDCLSQWRGYCPNGGGAIELDLMKPRQFSILYANYGATGQYKSIENAPLRVLYVPPNQALHEEIIKVLQAKYNRPDSLLKLYDLLPYFKTQPSMRRESGVCYLKIRQTHFLVASASEPCITA